MKWSYVCLSGFANNSTDSDHIVIISHIENPDARKRTREILTERANAPANLIMVHHNINQAVSRLLPPQSSPHAQSIPFEENWRYWKSSEWT